MGLLPVAVGHAGGSSGQLREVVTEARDLRASV